MHAPHDERADYDDEPGRTRPSPQALVRTPAGVLSSFALVQVGFSVVGLISTLAMTIYTLFKPGEIEDFDLTTGVLLIIASAILTGMNLFVARATDRMKRLQGHRSACWAAALSMLSLPFFYLVVLSFPAGIWALRVLSDPSVRARFDEGRAGGRS
jgi:hypothetical protein